MREGQFGTDYSFARKACITQICDECGSDKIKKIIEESNAELLKLNKTFTWHQWIKPEGKSAPQKTEVKGTLRSAVNEFLEIIQDLSGHLFRANWNRHVFQYIRSHLEVGYVLQVLDFAMNFNNRYQDEVQSAYWTGTQTTIHGTVNFFKCLNQGCNEKGCNEIVTLALVHISADMKHDSFLARAVMNMTFKYPVEIGVPLDLVIQFCDNCAAQYKSRRPFVEITRCALNLIRVYFGEKHGKSHADALFGRLKAWMTFKIKARHFVVKCAYDFYKFCREFYQTKIVPGCCQHYRVEFEFVRPCDVKRHQDSDFDKAVDHTQQIYSVRNTPEPLKMKVRTVPCLCPPCISDDPETICMNSSHTDPWETVNLIPQKGANKNKYKKRRWPDQDVIDARNREQQETPQTQNESVSVISYTPEETSDDNENEDITFQMDKLEEKLRKRNQERFAKRREERRKRENAKNPKRGNVTDSVTDFSGKASTSEIQAEKVPTHTWVSEEITEADFISSQSEKDNSDIEIIEIIEKNLKEFSLVGENILPKYHGYTDVTEMVKEMVPDSILWISLLSAIDEAKDFNNVIQMCRTFKERIPALKPRVIPVDGPITLKAVKTIGDGNCLPRALSRAFFNNDESHIEIRVRIIIEGVLNLKHYLTDNCLERGASVIHANADLPTVFTTFSEYYTPGQKIYEDTVACIYSLEIHSIARMGSYMGLWQLAQASSVFGVPVHTIYPVRGSSLRNDFHRIFFPVEYCIEKDDDPLVIMWTGMRRGAVPVHFVPLIPRSGQ